MESKIKNIIHNKIAFSLVEIMATLIIMAALISFAVVEYHKYIMKTRINALWQEAEAAKLFITNQYIKYDKALENLNYGPGFSIDDASFISSQASYVDYIKIEQGKITVQGKEEYFYDKNIYIKWIPTSQNFTLKWNCYYSTEAIQYVDLGNCYEDQT